MINGLAIDRIFENIFSSGIYFQDIYFTERLRTLAENIIIDIFTSATVSNYQSNGFLLRAKARSRFQAILVYL